MTPRRSVPLIPTLSQREREKVDTAPVGSPHPDPLPKGEGKDDTAPVGSLSPLGRGLG
ncbi:hypothetical protein SB5857_00087 [Klebsiella africana]|uniref:Uncharacterized protein n=1 Tax=Klebsiella africana TaxID=2489010 RepID=A0A8B6IK16_9ENTR|nr:hypothetical protein SB5857_00087 [Klebsiella africana]